MIDEVVIALGRRGHDLSYLAAVIGGAGLHRGLGGHTHVEGPILSSRSPQRGQGHGYSHVEFLGGLTGGLQKSSTMIARFGDGCLERAASIKYAIRTVRETVSLGIELGERSHDGRTTGSRHPVLGRH